MALLAVFPALVGCAGAASVEREEAESPAASPVVADAYAREIERVMGWWEHQIGPVDEADEGRRYLLKSEWARARRKVADDLAHGRYEPLVAVVRLDGWWSRRVWHDEVVESFLQAANEQPGLLQNVHIREAVEALAYTGHRRTSIEAARAMSAVDRELAIGRLGHWYGGVAAGERVGPWFWARSTNVAPYLRELGEYVPDELTELEPLKQLQVMIGDEAIKGANKRAAVMLAADLFNQTLQAHYEANRKKALERLQNAKSRRELMFVCLQSAEKMLLCANDGELEEPPPLNVFGGGEEETQEEADDEQ